MRKLIITITGLMILVMPVAAQQDDAVSEVIRRLGGTGGEAVSIDVLFREVGDLLVGADRENVTVLAERLRTVNQELAMLESWQRRSEGSSAFIELPMSLFEDLSAFEPSEILAARAEAKVSRLRSQLEIEREKLAQRRESEDRPMRLEDGRRGSQAALAALAVDIEIPLPPATQLAPASEVLAGTNHKGMGRALFTKRDWAGALIAFERIAEADRDPEVLYRMAYCHDLLENWEEAEAAYRLVLDKVADGHWRRSAEYQLGILAKKRRVRTMLGPVSADRETEGER